MLELTRGDDAVMPITDLAFNGTPTNFLGGDKVTFTLKREWDDADAAAAIVKSSNVSGGVTLNIGLGTGTVNIAAADWAGVAPLPKRELWVYDLQLIRSGAVTTLIEGNIVVKPDATITAP